MARSKELNVSRSAADDDERHVLGQSGGGGDAVDADGERDGVDLPGAVGLEDLVQGAHGDLVHGGV